MKRYLTPFIEKDLPKKIILLSGPRQSGKTTLSKSINSQYEYLNYDIAEDRQAIANKSWDRSQPLLILDELHKMPEWKRWLKGIYDGEGLTPPIMVTGSARLDTFKKVGDSLAGRYFPFRLHPLDLKECVANGLKAEEALTQLMQTGGFPEPFLAGDADYYQRWRRTHLDIILRQDLISLESVRELTKIETLIELLRERVASPISARSLAIDLQVSTQTVQRWLNILEDLFVIFKVTPFHKNIARSILQSPKIYFYDQGLVKGDAGTQFENLVACALLKEIQFRQDCFGKTWQLHYLRNRNGKEVDFYVADESHQACLVEVKLSDDSPSPHLRYFLNTLTQASAIQIVHAPCKTRHYPIKVDQKQTSDETPSTASDATSKERYIVVQQASHCLATMDFF